ncbi:MAG: DUF4432 family protein [Clostridia bacterium]|nr:DUF4432 family protein [Clostridia bacterium]
MTNKKISNMLQTGFIRRYTLTDGKENGLKVIEMDNGILRVLLNESKALDVMQVFYEGKNMSFVSKNGFQARELPFLKRFEGGMVYTCGLDSVGDRDGFEAHGSFHSTPARVVEILQNDNTLLVKAITETTSLCGENLCFVRTVTLNAGESKLNINDKLINKGTKKEDFCLLYHINVGYPMLDEGVEIQGDFSQVIPRTEYSSTKMVNRAVFEAPVDNADESCFFIKNNGNYVCATNKKLGTRFIVTYSKETLPCFVQWNNPVTQAYALGLEPATTFLDDKFEYTQIDKDEEIDFFIQLSFEKI